MRWKSALRSVRASEKGANDKSEVGFVEKAEALPTATLLAFKRKDDAQNEARFWPRCLGLLSAMVLSLMIISGLFLAMYYKGNTAHAFASIEKIRTQIPLGAFMLHLHSLGASAFFCLAFAHLGHGLYVGAYKGPRARLWQTGVVLLLLMMSCAFTGYTLPWGQMSFWALTVVAGLLETIPFIGETASKIFMPSSETFTLKPLLLLHVVLPFILWGMTKAHHHKKKQTRQNQPAFAVSSAVRKKMYKVFALFFGALVVLSLVAPDFLFSSGNAVMADPLQTPEKIMPEWYFLPFFAMLRSFTGDIIMPYSDHVLFTAQQGGGLVMGGAVGVLFFLPYLDRGIDGVCCSTTLFKLGFVLFVADFALLGYCGTLSPDGWVIEASKSLTVFYFAYLLLLLPVLRMLSRRSIKKIEKNV